MTPNNADSFRLLMITQVVDENDPIFGATLHWIEAFSRSLEQLHVICLKEGSHDLPENVTIHSLGKENRTTRFTKLFRLYRFTFSLITQVDGLFIHQGQLYTLLIAPLFRVANKPVIMWKTHGHVPWTMKAGLPFTDRVLTASEESFDVDTSKKVVTGHGIDTGYFKPTEKARQPFSDSGIKLVSAGRISPTKQIREMIELVKYGSREHGLNVTLTLIGEPATDEDRAYQQNLMTMIEEETLTDRINWTGFIPYRVLPERLEQYDLFLNFSKTGSIDKALLEAMSLGRPVLTTNPAFEDFLPEKYPSYSGTPDPYHCTSKLVQWSNSGEPFIREYQETAREIVVEHHSLKSLGQQLLEQFNAVSDQQPC